MSQSKPIALFSMSYPDKTAVFVGYFGWNPLWKSVEDIRVWAKTYIPFSGNQNVEVYANGKVLSQETKVERPTEGAPISILPWNSAGQSLYSEMVQRFDVCAF
jgi:hypothetical protein